MIDAISRIPCHFAQIRSYRTSVKLPQLRLSAVITIEEFPKSGGGLLLKDDIDAVYVSLVSHCVVVTDFIINVLYLVV